MRTLVETSSVPYEAVRLTQNARLVPSDQIAVERQKALARYRTDQLRYSQSGKMDFDYIHQIRKAFSKSSIIDFKTLNQRSNFSSASLVSITSNVSKSPVSESIGLPGKNVNKTEFSDSSYYSENSTSYAVQRGAFEMRVARGDISYIPALTMTIVTQYPELHFEYTGDFNYVPPQDDPNENSVDIQI